MRREAASASFGCWLHPSRLRNDSCPTQSNSQRSTHEGRENGREVSPGRRRPGGRPASPRRVAAGTPPAAPAHNALSTKACATRWQRHDRSAPAVAPTSDRPAAAGTPPRSARSHTCNQTDSACQAQDGRTSAGAACVCRLRFLAVLLEPRDECTQRRARLLFALGQPLQRRRFDLRHQP